MTNSQSLRSALAAAIKDHITASGMNGVSGGKVSGIGTSRMCSILRGDVDKISADALADVLGNLGYRVSSVIGSNDGHEISFKLVGDE